jgi:hypothetical protein
MLKELKCFFMHCNMSANAGQQFDDELLKNERRSVWRNPLKTTFYTVVCTPGIINRTLEKK